MQNSTCTHVEENETARLSQLLKRIKLAFKLITSRKATVIINNSLHSFQTTPEEVSVVCQQITSDINIHLVQEEIITRAVHNLVFN